MPPAALTLEEKKERAEAKRNEVVNQTSVPEQVTASGVRRKRGTFNGTQAKLSADVDKIRAQGYHVHIVNDMDNRISELLDRGYEFILSHEVEGITINVVSRNTDIGDKVRFLVGTQKTGDPLYAYLMKIKQEWYDEDMRDIQDRNDKIDESIRRGKTAIGDNGNFYAQGDIKMKT